jgi:carboxylesterase
VTHFKTPARDLTFALKGTLGKAVLLIHGMTGAPGEMKFLAKRLHRRGFSVAAPLLAGHGVDEANLLRTTWQDWLGSVREGYQALKADHDEVYVAGICVGGALGLALAAEDPSVAGAAVYSMTYRYDGWNMKHWYSAVVPYLEPFAALPLVRRLSFVEPYPFGLKDERLRDRLGGPTALHLLDDCYHMIHVDRQRDLVGDLTADFFGAPAAKPRSDLRHAEPVDA